MVSRDFDLAVGALKEAINLNPSFALAHMILASTYGYGGEGDEGLRYVAVANRLSPRDFAQAANFSTAGLCQFMAGRYAEGVELERKAVELRPYFVAAWRTLAACAGMAGENAISAHAVSQAKRLQPSLSLEWVEKYHPIVRSEDRERYICGLKVGGLA
jgi:adenylate cyclase